MSRKHETSAQQTERILAQTSKIEALQKERAKIIQQRLSEIEFEIEDLVIERDFLTQRLRDKRSEPRHIIEREVISRLKSGEVLPHAGMRNPQYKEALSNLRRGGYIKNLSARGERAKWVLTEKAL